VTRALVWGQFRRHWPVVACIIIVGCMADPYWVFFGGSSFDASAGEPLFMFLDRTVCIVMLLGLGLLSVNPHSQPARLFHFPRDLFRLPVSSLRLVVTVLACRITAAAVFAAPVLLVTAYRAGNVASGSLLGVFLVLMGAFVCFQALAWIAGVLILFVLMVVLAYIDAGVTSHQIPWWPLGPGIILLAPFMSVLGMAVVSFERR